MEENILSVLSIQFEKQYLEKDDEHDINDAFPKTECPFAHCIEPCPSPMSVGAPSPFPIADCADKQQYQHCYKQLVGVLRMRFKPFGQFAYKHTCFTVPFHMHFKGLVGNVWLCYAVQAVLLRVVKANFLISIYH